MAQGECALDAENTVKLFTMDQAQPGKPDEFTYEIALQVRCCGLAWGGTAGVGSIGALQGGPRRLPVPEPC